MKRSGGKMNRMPPLRATESSRTCILLHPSAVLLHPFPMARLLVATKNAHKAAEIRAILGPEWEVTDLNAHRSVVPPEETGETFAENAEIKAIAASRIFPGLV